MRSLVPAGLALLLGSVTTAPAEELRLAQLADQRGLAAYEGRLARMEEDLRRLTGRFEELENAHDRALRRVDELERAIEAREVATAAPPEPLVAREPGATDPASDSDAAAPSAPSAPPAPATPARLPGGLAPPEGTLGQVPEDAVRSLPPPRAVARAPEPDGAATYEGALAQMQAGRFADAAGSFEAFLAANPQDRRAPSAAYWLAESQFVRKDYESAAASFARNYRTYGPEAPRASDNLLKLGMALAALGDAEKACQTFEALATRHPGAPAPVKQALSRERAAADCG